jgi:hypothetical protein
MNDGGGRTRASAISESGLIAALSGVSVEARTFFLTLPFAELACCLDKSIELRRLVRAYEHLSTQTLSPTIEELFREVYGEP